MQKGRKITVTKLCMFQIKTKQTKQKETHTHTIKTKMKNSLKKTYWLVVIMTFTVKTRLHVCKS